MNTSQLKRFAQEARRKLISQVGARLELVLTTDSIALREKAAPLRMLREELQKTSKEQLIEKVAYIWFNRLMALRFMDVNDYQPLNLLVVTPREGFTLPEILHEAKQGYVPDELPANRQRIFDLLDGRLPLPNPQNEAYKELLIGACNYLHKLFPFMFERISDYTELLLPDDLTSEFSIVRDIRDGMQAEDCKQVEIIGWLYQFYISEKKDEVFASKSKVEKEDIPAATQLFTPRWIVEYMVQNTVGKLWLQNRPQSKLKDFMPYYIESPSAQSSDFLKVDSVEEIRLLDQAAGSGHILVYGFELFTHIYEEEGYSQDEIPALIIRHNLFGFEIDERAAQLAAMALMMKARGNDRRVFQKEVYPHVVCFKDFSLSTEETTELFNHHGLLLTEQLAADLKNMQQATNLGSLIVPRTPLSALYELGNQLYDTSFSDAFLQQQALQVQQSIDQLIGLSEKYHCIVDNPPYMGGGNMNQLLSYFVKFNYPDSKSDLMACFMEAGLRSLLPNGFLGMINQHSWMFLSSYESLRKKLIDDTFFDTMLHLGPRTFPEIGGEVVQNTAFTFWNSDVYEKGSYIRLVDYERSDLKKNKTLEAIQNPDCGWFYTANQKDFEKIPGSPISFWTKGYAIKIFEEHKSLKHYASPSKGMMPGPTFIRFFWEIGQNNIAYKISTHDESSKSDKKWYPYFKGGTFRKWYGNREYVVDFYKDGKNLKKSNYGERNPKYYFLRQLNWTKISSGSFSIRDGAVGGLYDDAACQCPINREEDRFYLLGYLNTKLSTTLLGSLSNTLNFSPGEIAKIPVLYNLKIHEIVAENSESCYAISKEEWNSKEIANLFIGNGLIKLNSQNVEKANDLYQQYWKFKFFQLHQNEEELNRQFIEIYGLQEELTPDVPLEDITILQRELDRTALKKLNNKLVREAGSMKVLNYDTLNLPFDSKEIMEQLISYAVGCMFGRYSLQKEGLILANQGETIVDFVKKVAGNWWMVDGNGNWRFNQDSPSSGKHPESGQADQRPHQQTPTTTHQPLITFWPDEDNIIPVLDEEWFEDDIVTRFQAFLKAAFGSEHFDQNLAFVEQQLGKTLRKYFTRDFYTDHIQRYKKRPIYWLFSSASGAFNVLIYLHRYTPDTINNILNKYLRQFQEKIRNQMLHNEHLMNSGTAVEQSKASRDKDRLNRLLMELQEYEREVIYPMATDRIPIDLDDGVLVNYNKFGKAVKEVNGLNDKKTKAKVKKFDWIDQTQIR